jgi:hypothetical protein
MWSGLGWCLRSIASRWRWKESSREQSLTTGSEIFTGAGALNRLTVGMRRERLPRSQNRDLFDEENLRDNEGDHDSQDPSSH